MAERLRADILAGQASTITVQTSKGDQPLKLTNEWDKVFPKSDLVDHQKVTFHNRYGITLAADMYTPKNAKGKLPAIAVAGPFGAVKEQSSGLYAQKLAEMGYLTIAFDPSFTGESGGTPRDVASPDINTEDFSAAVDFLSTRDNVDPNRIGILGICGWGGMALNAAAMDTRIKATVTSTMYDMSRVTANGYFDKMTPDDRYEMRKALNEQRTEDYKNDTYAKAGGVVNPLPDDAPVLREGLPRLLQDKARLSSAFRQFECRMEQDISALLYEHAASLLRRGNQKRCSHRPWRQGAFLLLQPGCIQEAEGGQ